MLILNKQDIEQTVDLNRMMDTIESAYQIFGEQAYYMPPRPTVTHENKTLIYMPCYTQNSLGTKILTVFPDNASLSLPSIDGVVLLNHRDTGKPVALLDGQTVTAFRTGAVGGVAIRHLSRKDCHTVGIVGAGVQGFYQAVYACTARDIHTVYVFNHGNRNIEDYIARLEKAIGNGVKVVWCKDVVSLVKQSDIICTATPAVQAVLPDDKALLRGKCIVAVGSYTPAMREIPDAIWDLVNTVYIELPYACEESGDLSQPIEEGRLTQDRTILMSDLLQHPPREIKSGETTYFKSVGMGLFDICAANYLMKAALEKGYGQQVDM